MSFARSSSRGSSAAALALAFGLAGAEALAQLEEVVVTAQRREEALQEVPISVTAISAQELTQRSSFDVTDIEQFTPGLTNSSGGTGGSGQQGNYFIRGIGQGEFTAVQDPGVATYIDGVYLGRTGGANFRLLDIERIEVLRGPQGTLFGRNAVGGAINVVTAEPTGEFGGRALIRTGSRDRLDGELLFDFPITDVLAGKLSALWHTQDGYSESVIDDRTFGDTDMLAGRLKLRLAPSDRWDATLNVDASRSDGTTNGTILIDANENNGNFFFGLQQVAFPNERAMAAIGAPPGSGIRSEISSDPFLSYQSIDPIDEVDIWGTSLNVTFDFDAFSVRSITAYRELDQTVANDYDGSRFVYFDQLLTTIQDQFSQEVHFFGNAANDRLTWQAGLFYFTETSDQNNAISQGGSPFRLDHAAAVVQNQRFTNDTDSYAAFTQLTWDLTERWAVTGGVRYTNEEKSTVYNFTNDNRAGTAVYVRDGFLGPNAAFAWPSLLGDVVPLAPSRLGFPFLPGSSCSGVLIDPVPAPPFTCRPPGIIPIPLPAIEEDWDAWTGRAALEYQATEDLLGYLSWSRGFKSGGVNSRPIAAADVVPFDPETVDQYELGMKSDWADNRVRLNVAAYYSDYQDIQQLIAPPPPPPGQPQRFFIIENIGDVDMYGVEAELTAVPVEPLRLNLGVTWAETDVAEVRAPTSGVVVGNELTGRPDWLIFAGAQYTFPLAAAGSLALRADWYSQGDSWDNAQNTDRSEGYDLLNLRATFSAPEDRWSVSLFGRNVTDEEYSLGSQNVVSSFGTHFGWFGAPREWGLELNVNF